MASRTSVPYVPGGPPNKQQLPFFVDDQMNKVIPPWFVSCEREEAEKKLARRYPGANVYLMRPSKTSGPFALTVQTFNTSYKRTLHHYSVVFHRASGTFRIDIDKTHAPTKTLSEIMEIFTKLNKPIIYCIYGLGTSAPTSPASPKSPPTLNALTCQLTAVVLPVNKRAPDVIPRPVPPYLLLQNDYPPNRSLLEGEYLTTNDDYLANSSVLEGEYLTTNDSDEHEENRFGSVDSPSTNTAQTPDGYVVVLDDDDDMAPLEKAPPPPVSRKASGNSVSQRTATGLSDYIQPNADDDDYVAPQVSLSTPPIRSSSSRLAARINTKRQNLRVDCGINRSMK